MWLVERWAEGQNTRRTIIRQKEAKYPRLYALLPEVQLTRDSRDREEEEVGGGVERLPSPAMRRLQRRRREAEDHWGGCMHLIYGGVLMWCCHFQTEWWLFSDSFYLGSHDLWPLLRVLHLALFLPFTIL